VCQIGACPADNSADAKRAVQLISTSPIFLLKDNYPIPELFQVPFIKDTITNQKPPVVDFFRDDGCKMGYSTICICKYVV
jgi:hypothetical protein